MKKAYSKSWNICGFCRYWNNGRGADSFEPIGITSCYMDNTETHPCSLNGFNKQVYLKCSKFERR